MSKLTAEDQQEMIKYLGLEEVESLEKAKETFQSSFVKSDELSSKIGKITGSIQNTARKIFEPFGVSLTDEDFKDKKIEDVLKTASDKANEGYTTKIEELKKRAEGNNNDELIKTWETKYNKLEGNLKETEQARVDALGALDTYKSEQGTREQEQKIRGYFDDNLKAVKLDPSASPITIKGFRAQFNETYDISIEGEEYIVKDKKSGEKIKDDKRAGSFLSLPDILTKEATDAGIILKNSNAGNPQRRPQQHNNPPVVDTNKKGLPNKFLGT